jgi:hypothetical protein
MAAANRASHSRSTEITIAVIGLAGALATAGFSNWDKMFPGRGVVTASYQGYQPTGNFETELRYFLEVTGARKQVEEDWKNDGTEFKSAILAKHPEISAEQLKQFNKDFDEGFEAAKKAMPTFDEQVAIILPVYSKYYSVAEIQKLIKLHSTEEMLNMSNRQNSINKELGPIWEKKMADALDKVMKHSEEKLKENVTK